MATQKHIKLAKDAYRQNLENGIKALLAAQENVAKELAKLTARLKALEEKEAKNVGQKPTSKRR